MKSLNFQRGYRKGIVLFAIEMRLGRQILTPW